MGGNAVGGAFRTVSNRKRSTGLLRRLSHEGDGHGFYVSLNQGTTAVLATVGRRRYLAVLAERAAADIALIHHHGVDGLLRGALNLPGTGELTLGYRAGNIVASAYEGAVPDPPTFLRDLDRLSDLYLALIEARESMNEDTSEEVPPDVQPGEEAKRYRWHRRAERNRRLAKEAKRFHGTTCQICDFNFADTYGDRGDGFIEAHHRTPFADLAARPTTTILDPRFDFAVVCANCHRMLHRKPGVTVERLRDELAGQPTDER